MGKHLLKKIYILLHFHSILLKLENNVPVSSIVHLCKTFLSSRCIHIFLYFFEAIYCGCFSSISIKVIFFCSSETIYSKIFFFLRLKLLRIFFSSVFSYIFIKTTFSVRNFIFYLKNLQKAIFF